jgi:NADPH:quinone reductase-like Zn-dependent oxidoreductase
MVKKTMWAAIQDQRRAVPPLVTADFTGQTVVVVGANTGLGFGTAVHFARMNPGKLILACRNEEKGKTAVASK